jgi:hypothetical protein
MKRLLLALAAATSLAAVIPAVADAAPWQPVNQRQANLEQRIDQGVRNGSLTRREAIQLRAEFNGIANLESQYRMSRPGLTAAERADLDRRFDVLSAKIAFNRHDNQDRGSWQNINQRQANLDRRIDQGIRRGELSRREAIQLRVEFRRIVQLEAQYRASRPGLTARERADLDRRFDLLSARIAVARH